MEGLERNNVRVAGVPDGQPIVFAHGFGCDQRMWRFVEPAFRDRNRTVLFDYVGFGGTDLRNWKPEKYGTLQGYADDLLDICRELELQDVVFVGHSVSAMVGVRAAITEPSVFERLVMVGPSPRYIDDEDYTGGFSEAAIDGLIDALDRNYLGWSASMAPTIMGNADRPELGEELTESFCRTDPEVAKAFARVTFLSDSRADLPQVQQAVLVLQCTDDPIAGEAVGRYVADHLPHGELRHLAATGHCPNLSAPDETIAEIERFLSRA